VADMPFVAENTGTRVSASHARFRFGSRDPPHRSTTGRPSRYTATAAPTSPRCRKFVRNASATLPNPASTSPPITTSPDRSGPQGMGDPRIDRYDDQLAHSTAVVVTEEVELLEPWTAVYGDVDEQEGPSRPTATST